MKRLLVLIMLTVLLAACGKKGPLVPPESLAPAPISDLQTFQKGKRFTVCLTPPGREEGGKPLKGLAGMQIFKREVLPPGEDCEECPTAYRPLRVIDPEYLQDVSRYGNLYCFADADLVEGKTYQYKAVALLHDGTASRDSNKARRKFIPPPAAPSLKAVSGAEGVSLEWTAVKPPKNGEVVGYNLYRKESGVNAALFPINKNPLRETRFLDTSPEFGMRYRYAVRSLAKVDGELAESDLSNEVSGGLILPED